MAMPTMVLATALMAMGVMLAVPSIRADGIDALHLADDPARADPVPPDRRGGAPGGPRVAAQPAPPQPSLTARDVKLNVNGFLAWALLDRQSGKIAGSPNHTSGTNSTESTVKAWITADYLRLLGQKQPTTQRLAGLSRLIRDSHQNAAEDIYPVDGRDTVTKQMIAIVGLTHTSVVTAWWSQTQVTARDAVRLGQCLADGRAAGPKWTSWVLSEMKQVRGGVSEEPNGGRWGIVDALPADLAKETA